MASEIAPSSDETAALQGTRDVLDRAVAHHVLAHVAGDDFFLGYSLARFQRQQGLDEDGLAAYLHCPVSMLPRLALFHRPEVHGPRFGEEVERIAARTGAERWQLGALLIGAGPMPA